MDTSLFRCKMGRAIGEAVSFDQLGGVGDVHYSSSYVRGNWANDRLGQLHAHDQILLRPRICGVH